jgi:hypothetical protein
MKRFPIGPALVCMAALAIARPALSTGPASCQDYRGKARIRVLLRPDEPAKAGQPKDEIGCQLQQLFLRPDRMLLSFDLYGIRQQRLAEGATEQEYQPAMGMVIEKRYHHLDKADTNPIIALQTSLIEFGRLLREAKSAHSVGKEKLLDYDCDLVEVDSRELVEKLGGLVGTGKGNGLRDGKTKAWVSTAYGVPVKLEMYTAAGNLGMSMAMDELQFNTGVKPEDLRLDVPPGTKKVSIDVDLAEKDWQQHMNQDLRKAVDALNRRG